MIFVSDIIAWICDNIDYTITVDNATDNGNDTYTFEICDTFILRTGKVIEINGDKYKIIEFEIDKYILIKPYLGSHTLDISSLTEFECYTVGYQSGTLRDADKERGSLRKLRKNALPFLWNRHPYDLVQNWEDIDPLFGTADLEWYLLDETNPKDYTVKDDDKEVIQPMYKLLGRIKDLINDNRQFFNEVEGNVTTRPYKELGVEGANGNTARLFEENLSGIRVQFDLDIREQAKCCKGSTTLPSEEVGLNTELNTELNG